MSEYIGFLEPMRMIDGKGLGRIRVCGMKRGEKWIALCDEDVRKEVGDTHKVFLTYLEESWLVEYGQLVKFQIQENEKEKDEEDHDSYIVKKSPLPPIKQIGFFLLPYKGDICRDSIQAALDSLDEVYCNVDWNYAFRFYFWKDDNEPHQLIGPFENEPLKNGVQQEKKTQSFPLSSDDVIIENEGWSYAVNKPANEATQLIDLGTNEDRATWFRNKIKKIAPNSEFLAKLDALGQSWRGDFKSLIKEQRKKTCR